MRGERIRERGPNQGEKGQEGKGKLKKRKGSNASQENKRRREDWRKKVKGHEENKGERQTNRSWGRKC